MAPTQTMEKDERTDSYRVAVAPFVPDDGRGFDGRAKSRRRRLPSSSKTSKSLSAIAEEIEVLKAQVDMDEHFIPLDELYSRYATDPNMGLTVPRVKEVQEVYGPNKYVEPQGTPEWVRLAKNLFGGFSVILWVGCCLSLITFSIQSDIMQQPPYENLVLGIILGIVAIVTGLFSFYQEMKAEHLIQTFKTFVPEYCSVIREGRWQTIPVFDLVMGDVIEIKAGDRIPADIRIIHAHNFKVDQSSLSGELEPQVKSTEFSNNNNPLETLNLAFSGTYATEGFCKGVVIRTGDLTISASLSHLTVTLQESDILLSDEITWWMQFFMTIATTVAVFMFLIAFMSGFHWLDAMIFLVGVIIAMVPEGLVAIVTISLTLTAKRLYNKNCLLKTLSCVEKVGAASVILTDRTGVLTQNVPMVSRMWIDGQLLDATEPDYQNPTFAALSRTAVLCNHAEIAETEDGRTEVMGEPDEVAVLRSFDNSKSIRQKHRKVCEIPFNRIGKFHVTIHDNNNPSEPGYTLMMKGSPEEIIQRCSTIYQHGKEWHLDDNTRDAFTQAFISMAAMGEKVISFCDYKLPIQKYPPGYPFDADEVNFPVTNLRFVGLLSLVDPLRPSVPDAISKCRTAGIRVMMVTGDHPIAAQATARAAGIFNSQSWTVDDIATSKNVSVSSIDPSDATAVVIHGSELKTMTPDRLNYFLNSYRDIIFARTSLQQKLHIIEGLQRLGSVVISTGVGVLDVPAVKKANLGVALNENNASVVKEAADIILLDNNFSTIVTAIEEGRLVFVNLRKSISYIMASNMPEFMAYLFFLCLGIPLPLGTITILVIDLGTDMVPAVSLAYESPEDDLLQRNPPNDFQDKLIDINLIDIMDGQIGMIQAIAGFFTYFVILGEHGFWFESVINVRRRWNALAYNDLSDSYGQEWTLEQRRNLEWTAHSGFFVSIVMCQWITLLMCKTRYLSVFQHKFCNSYLNFALVFETLLALVLIYTPGMGKAFRLMPVRINFWITGLIFCLIIFVYDECRRFLIRAYPKGWTKRNFY